MRSLRALVVLGIVSILQSAVSTRVAEEPEPEDEITTTASTSPPDTVKPSPRSRAHHPKDSWHSAPLKRRQQFSSGCDVEELVYRDCMRKQVGLVKSASKSPPKSAAAIREFPFPLLVVWLTVPLINDGMLVTRYCQQGAHPDRTDPCLRLISHPFPISWFQFVGLADAAVTQTMFGYNSSQPCYQCGSPCERYCCYSGQTCCLYSTKCSCCF